MSARNGEKARAAIERRRRTAQREKDRLARPKQNAAPASGSKGKAAEQKSSKG